MDTKNFFTSTPNGSALPIYMFTNDAYISWVREAKPFHQNWLRTTCEPLSVGQMALLPGCDGQMEGVLIVVKEPFSQWDVAKVSSTLPPGDYYFVGDFSSSDALKICYGWGLGLYKFDRFKGGSSSGEKRLCWPSNALKDYCLALLKSNFLARDLINMPANFMGPAELSEAAGEVADTFNAVYEETVGEALLSKGFRGIYTVGQASSSAPRLISIEWRSKKLEKAHVVLVGKGVCFDTGGLNIKSDSHMLLMKKDMGGAATVLALAHLIMAEELPIRLNVLLPCVENSIAGNAMRPLDVIQMYNGTTIEIGHTDAEGRIILADALALASKQKPDLIIDIATLTGAARVAMGAEIGAVFSNRDHLAHGLREISFQVDDPLWPLPLWQNYFSSMKSAVADFSSVGKGSLGGTIQAALFLEQFVAEATSWIHLDVMCWNLTKAQGRPEGGEPSGMRAVFELIKSIYCN